MKILLVDDDKIIRIGLAKMIKRIFEDNHEVVFNFQNGLVAFDYIKENKVDLVITDIKMPVMTGSELIEKAVNELENPPMFIVLSGYDEFTYVRDTMKLGAFNYLLKPLKVQELKLVLEKIEENESISIALFTDGYSNAFKNKLDLFNSIESTLQEYNKSIFSRFRLVNTYVNYLNSISKNITHDDISIVFIV